MQLAQLSFWIQSWHEDMFMSLLFTSLLCMFSCHTSRPYRLSQVACNVSTAGFKWSGNSASPAQTRTVPGKFWSVPSVITSLCVTTPNQTAIFPPIADWLGQTFTHNFYQTVGYTHLNEHYLHRPPVGSPLVLCSPLCHLNIFSHFSSFFFCNRQIFETVWQNLVFGDSRFLNIDCSVGHCC